MTDDELLGYLGAAGDNVELTVLVRLERPGDEAFVGTLSGPNAWLRPPTEDGGQQVAISVEAVVGLLGSAARLIAEAAGQRCEAPHPERCDEADDIIAALLEVGEAEIGGEKVAARDVMLIPATLSRPFEPRREWGVANGWRLVTEMVATAPGAD